MDAIQIRDLELCAHVGVHVAAGVGVGMGAHGCG